MIPGAQQEAVGGIKPREYVYSSVEIPTVDDNGELYRTWSLFLICNPAWLDGREELRVEDLRRQFELFGDVIGGKNLAVWFAPVGSSVGQAGRVLDISRNVEFCDKYQLLRSESPHIITTTSDPNLDVPAGDQWILSLSGQTSGQIMNLLTKLADQLTVENLDQEQLGSEQWWRSWFSAFDRTLLAAAEIASRVKLTIKTANFSVEIAYDR